MSVMDRLREHWEDAKKHIPEENMFCLCLQGSQNYGLDLPDSDVDSKLLIIPTLENLIFYKPISETFIRDNGEHIDFKDIRTYFKNCLKQNINFLEIFFTDYYIVNPLYEKEWALLRANAEAIAHYDMRRAADAAYGTVRSKAKNYNTLRSGKEEIFEKHGYDPKEVSHLIRVADLIERYLKGESFKSCLKPHNQHFLKMVKQGLCTQEEAHKAVLIYLEKTAKVVNNYHATHTHTHIEKVLTLFDNVTYNLIKKALKKELK